MSLKPALAAITVSIVTVMSGAANAAWQPAKPIEFIATAGPGGGTDNFARAVQNIIIKYKLVDQPIVVTNKAGGSGAEG
jgi:putative tricarboxylic transport membrane protein